MNNSLMTTHRCPRPEARARISIHHLQPFWVIVAMILSIMAFFGSVAPMAQASAVNVQTSQQDRQAAALCARQTEQHGRLHGLPDRLLTAISLVETGRYDRGLAARVAWPWTVMAEGRGRYFPTKAQALQEVRQLQARGVSNIDVGCMQVNLHFHGDAFDTLEDALDPGQNVAYASDFLVRLAAQAGNWAIAVTRYHSRTPKFAGRYAGRIAAAWQEAAETGAMRDALFGIGSGQFALRGQSWASSLPLGPGSGPAEPGSHTTTADASHLPPAEDPDGDPATPTATPNPGAIDAPPLPAGAITAGRVVPDGIYYSLSPEERLRREEAVAAQANQRAKEQSMLLDKRAEAVRDAANAERQADRDQAKRYAENWRAKQLEAYLARKAARTDEATD